METVEIKTLNDIVDVEEPLAEIKKNGPFELTEEQKQKILDAWNNASKTSPPSLKDLVVAALGSEFDGRSLEAKSVKSFLASRDIKAKPLISMNLRRVQFYYQKRIKNLFTIILRL